MYKSQRQLGWIHRNRPTPRLDTIGVVVRRVIESHVLRGPKWRRGVLTMLEEHAGSELLDHVANLDLRNGILKLEVKEAAAAYHLGMLWEQRLLMACQMNLPAAGVHTVRFIPRAST